MTMMDEFALADLSAISDFILTRSREATLERINALEPGEAHGSMRIDGYSHPVDLKVLVRIEKDRIVSDWAGTSGLDKKESMFRSSIPRPIVVMP